MLLTVLYKHLVITALTLWLTLSPLHSEATQLAANGAANSANNGLAAAADDGTLYYLDLTGDIYAGGQENIYRLRPGAASPELICADEAWNLTISGKYLYYSNWSDQHYLYRIKPDGSEKTKLSSQPVSALTAANRLLIYATRGNNGEAVGIYTLSADNPTTPQKLADDLAENLIVNADWIYYLNAADQYRIYKIKTDGTGRCKLADEQAVFMAVAQDTIYYSNAADNQKLYAMSLDGRQITKLTDNSVGFINIIDNWIYYTDSSAHHALYRMNTTNLSQQQLCDLGIGPQPILLVNNLVYYNRLFFKR
ncbi:MAG: N-acetylmuramoyl-L-alanine amidase CwlD [Firmicutes bacterium]|nr:N-acetylmuramoyl-L-alanine amidase CwlD [Bacillota bacterium]